MRSFVLAVFALFSFTTFAGAQNSAQMAAQAAQQANQQALQAAQQANDDAMRANQQAMQAAQQANDAAMRANSCCGPHYAAEPHFSAKSGIYHRDIKVRLKDRTRGAVMYYTIDGWTPTTASLRYTGPITISSTTTLRAIAVAPGCLASYVTTAVYTLPGAPPAVLPSTTFAWLNSGTPLPFVFTSAVTSKGLEIGDRLPVALAQDLVVGGVLVAPKLTPARATVMQVDGPAGGGRAGTITFAVHSIRLTNGETIQLSGTETIDGPSHLIVGNALYIVPLGGLFVHGKQAIIPKGAVFTGYVESGGAALSANAASGSAPRDLP